MMMLLAELSCVVKSQCVCFLSMAPFSWRRAWPLSVFPLPVLGLSVHLRHFRAALCSPFGVLARGWECKIHGEQRAWPLHAQLGF